MENTVKVEVFAICDAATEMMGKLNLLGAFDTLWAPRTPVVHQQCAIAARVRFDRIERGSHAVRLDIVDQDGKAIMPTLNGSVDVRIPDAVRSSVAHLIINIQQLKFDNFGEYVVNLAIDGRQEASLPLFVRQQPANSGGPAPAR